MLDDARGGKCDRENQGGDVLHYGTIFSAHEGKKHEFTYPGGHSLGIFNR